MTLLQAVLAAFIFFGQATAYHAGCRGCTGVTAPPPKGTGTIPVVGKTLACPPRLPARAWVYVTSVGFRRCEDRGGAIRGNVVDVFVPDSAAAVRFGRRNVLVIRLARPTSRRILDHVTMEPTTEGTTNGP